MRDPSAGTAADLSVDQFARLLEATVDSVHALIYLKDADDGRYLFVNRHYAEVAQRRREDILGRTDFDLWPDAVAATYASNDRAVVEAGDPMEFEEPLPEPDGHLGRWLSHKFTLKDERGKPFAVGGISTDFRVRNRAEAMIRAAIEEAERANRAKSEFLSRMSHELRTPLNSIVGFSQLLQLEDLSPENRDSVEHILGASRHLLALINEVLDISRIEAGTLQVAVEVVSACEPLTEAYELVRPMAASRGITLARDLHGALYRQVHADHQRLKQVLLNVLMNALKYNREGGMITVTTEATGDFMRYRIIDTGIGMDGEDADKVFVPFERLGISSADVEGTGLGLSLSRTLVEAMGGRIGVERTTKGMGSVFYVDVRLVEEADRKVDEAPPEMPVAPREHLELAPLTVLYIEDNLANLELVRRILGRTHGLNLIPAIQGALGVELAALHHPDIVLLDLHLPDIEGEEVLRRLRQQSSTSKIPVLILSADATPSRIEQLKAAGATGYLTKPFDVATFVDSIQSAVDRG